MKYFTVLFLLVLFCREEKAISIEDRLKEISIMKNKIIVVYFDEKTGKRFLRDKSFPKNMLSVSEKAKKYNPSVIYFNQTTMEKSVYVEDYEIKLNKDLPIISSIAFLTNKSDGISNEIKKLIGTKIKGEPMRKGYQFFQLSGVQFPYIEFIKNSKAICLNGNTVSPDGDYGTPYYTQYENYMFENCPITIANEFLSNYKLKIAMDWSVDTPTVYEFEKGKWKRVKQLVSPEIFGTSFEIPFQFRDFRSIDLNEFLEQDLDIEPGMIFIVSNSINEFKIANGKVKYPYQILPSEVYNLLDLVSQPLEKEK